MSKKRSSGPPLGTGTGTETTTPEHHAAPGPLEPYGVPGSVPLILLCAFETSQLNDIRSARGIPNLIAGTFQVTSFVAGGKAVPNAMDGLLQSLNSLFRVICRCYSGARQSCNFCKTDALVIQPEPACSSLAPVRPQGMGHVTLSGPCDACNARLSLLSGARYPVLRLFQ
ncbi:hypothetical protein VTL71DRAFT_1905 [Oculimacula yallundae]|uniref:Uncharacterized protein n=1 Tax=Oculimacula yallundae TaxID=86028 RepID=A0ABR4CCJ2_9HELO